MPGLFAVMSQVRLLQLRERIWDTSGSIYFWQEWYGAVPPRGMRYRVLHDDWTTGRDGYPVRRIYAWETAYVPPPEGPLQIVMHED